MATNQRGEFSIYNHLINYTNVYYDNDVFYQIRSWEHEKSESGLHGKN